MRKYYWSDLGFAFYFLPFAWEWPGVEYEYPALTFTLGPFTLRVDLP